MNHRSVIRAYGENESPREQQNRCSMHVSAGSAFTQAYRKNLHAKHMQAQGRVRVGDVWYKVVNKASRMADSDWNKFVSYRESIRAGYEGKLPVARDRVSDILKSESELEEYLRLRTLYHDIKRQKVHNKQRTGIAYDVSVPTIPRIDIKVSRAYAQSVTLQRNKRISAIMRSQTVNRPVYRAGLYYPRKQTRLLSPRVYSWVESASDKRKIAVWKTDVKTRLAKLTPKTPLPILSLLESDCKGFLGKTFVSLPQAHKAYNRLVVTVLKPHESEYLSVKVKTGKRIRKCQHKTQYVTITDNESGKVLVSRRFTLTIVRDSGGRDTGKLKSSKHVFNHAKKHGIKIPHNRTKPVTSGAYTSACKRYTMEVK